MCLPRVSFGCHFLGFHLDNVNLSIHESADRCFLLRQIFPNKTFSALECINVLRYSLSACVHCFTIITSTTRFYVRWKGALMVAMYLSANSSVAMSLYLEHGCNPRIYGMHATDIYSNPISWAKIAYPAPLLTPQICQLLVAVCPCHIEFMSIPRLLP